jgi:formate/nitrite transporter FocA (FNT family)
MARPSGSLWWSGVAAGMSISFSLLAQSILQVHLPDAQWRPLISGLGYPAGFIMVVMSRQQLFTDCRCLPSSMAEISRGWRECGRLS